MGVGRKRRRKQDKKIERRRKEMRKVRRRREQRCRRKRDGEGWRLKERIGKEKEMENERKWAKIRKGDREVKQRGIKKRGRGKKDSEGEK
jgi:hypothetical protein